MADTDEIDANRFEIGSLTAGLVLIRALITGAITPEIGLATAVNVIAFQINALLDQPAAETSLVGAARAVLQPDELEKFVELPVAAGLPEPVLFDVLRLADLMRTDESSATRWHRDEWDIGPSVVVEQPDGRGVVVVARIGTDSDNGTLRTLNDPSDISQVEEALEATLAPFPTKLTQWKQGRRPVLSVRWLAEVPFAAPACGLAVALWHVAEVTGLVAPEILVAGDLSGARCRPLVGVLATARRRAAQAAGCFLMMPMSTGFVTIAPDGRETSINGELTLGTAARALWGSQWDAWCRRQHAEELRALGWCMVDLACDAATTPISDADTAQSRNLVNYFGTSQRCAIAVIAGTRKTGKSTAVRRMAYHLTSRKRNAWTVHVVERKGDRQLPDVFEANDVAAHVLAMSEGSSARRLLVFENLQPLKRSNIDEVLDHVCREHQISVLGVLELQDNSPVEWQMSGVYRVRTAVGVAERRRFIEDIAPAGVMLSVGQTQQLAKDRSIDLRRITQMVAGQRPQEEVARRFSELSNSARHSLIVAAVMSLLRCEVDAETLDLDELTDDDRLLFGIVVSEEGSLAHLDGVTDCLQLIDLYIDHASRDGAAGAEAPRQRRISAIHQLAAPLLTRALADDNPFAAHLLIGSRLYDAQLCRALFEEIRTGGQFEDWVSIAPITSVVQLFGLSDMMPEPLWHTTVERLVQRVDGPVVGWSPTALRQIVSVLIDNSAAMSEQTIDEFVRWLVEAVKSILRDRTGHPEERFALLEVLNRLDDSLVQALLAEFLLDVLQGLRVDSVGSYRLVRKVRAMQARLMLQAPEEVADDPIDQEPTVQELLNHSPAPEDGFGVVVESLCLRAEFMRTDWDTLMETHLLPSVAALSASDARAVADAVNSFRSTMPQAATLYLSKLKPSLSSIRAVLLRAPPLDAATLLRALQRANIEIAWRLLAPRGEQSDPELVNQFVNRIVYSKTTTQSDVLDPLSAGLLISATHDIGNFFYSNGTGFATDLAEAIGPDAVRRMLEDTRMSACYHLIAAVWDVRASYCDYIIDLVLDRIIEPIRRGRKHWGAELALRLCRDGIYREYVVQELRDRLSPDLMVRHMVYADTAPARVVFHRLGRALFPKSSAMFSSIWDLHAFADGLGTSAPGAALSVCAEAAKTLSDADIPHAGRAIFEATGGSEEWARRLARGRQPAVLAQALRDLIQLDKVGSKDVVAKLYGTPTRLIVVGRPIDALTAAVRSAMVTDAATAAMLVGALQVIDDDLTRSVLETIYEDSHTMYIFFGEVTQIQNPMKQADVATAFARTGMRRGTREGKWLNAVYEWRVKTAHAFVSPRAAEALVRMTAVWDINWGNAIAENLSTGRIVKRLSHGRRDDLGPTVRLIRTLCAIDRVQQAGEILDGLLANDIATIAQNASISALCQLVDITGRLRPEHVGAGLRHLRTAIMTMVEDSTYLDERALWQRIGRALVVLRSFPGIGVPDLAARDPWIPPNAAYSPAVALVAAEIGDPQWGDNALARARTRLRTWTFDDPVDTACVLLASAGKWEDEIDAQLRTSDISSLPFKWLRLLYGRRDYRLINEILTATEESTRERITRNTARTDWDAYQLRLILSAGVSQYRVSDARGEGAGSAV